MHMTHFSWQVRDIHALLIPFATILDKIGQELSTQTSTCLFEEGGESINFVVASAFKSFILKLDMATSINSDLKWLDSVFQGQYLPSLSINYFAINKDVEKLPPQL